MSRSPDTKSSAGAPDSGSSSTQSGLMDLVRSHRILVFIGAGGVGKTTTSIGAAILGAMAGKRVALLSIDPAKRLAAALGMQLGNDLAPINLKDLPGGGTIQGSVHAAMLDQKAVFDAMVRKHAPSKSVEARILADPLYRAASTNLAGPLEYMALARLHELADDPSWDLVVLDTPPDTHALDFLARPNLLSGFMDNKVLSWLVKPFLMAGRFGFGKVLSLGEKLMGGMASITGVDALRNFGEFLVLMQEVIEGFHKSGERVVEILRSAQTGFVMVTVPTRAAERSAIFLAGQLQTMGYGLDAVVLNRCLPAAVSSEIEAGRGTTSTPGTLDGILAARAHGESKVIDGLAGKLEKSQTTAGSQTRRAVRLVRVDELTVDLHTRDSVLAFAESLRAAGRRR